MATYPKLVVSNVPEKKGAAMNAIGGFSCWPNWTMIFVN